MSPIDPAIGPEKARELFRAELAEIRTDAALQALRTRWVGRKGSWVAAFMESLATAAPDQKKALGRGANELKKEVEAALSAENYRAFLENMYGSKPERWDDSLRGWDRLRVIVNAMTRMRFCKADGRMDFQSKGEKPPKGFEAWFDVRPGRDEPAIVFGHWSARGLKLTDRIAALDTGCVWGGSLTALRLEDRWLAQVPSRGYQRAGGKA